MNIRQLNEEFKKVLLEDVDTKTLIEKIVKNYHNEPSVDDLQEWLNYQLDNYINSSDDVLDLYKELVDTDESVYREIFEIVLDYIKSGFYQRIK